MIAPPVWLDPRESYLLGISGGRDSIFLHHWLRDHNFNKITYCHLNHGLRGDESDGDESFLQQLLGKQLISTKEDVAKLAKTSKSSLETAARHARHHFFQQCAQETGIYHVLLGHHADDQAETILFNLLRGSAGAKGMDSRQIIDDLVFLRPMLNLRRFEINDYLRSRNLPYREDSTNQEPIASRNRLRNEVLPLLESIMARDPVPSLLKAQQSTSELEKIADFALNSLSLEDPQGRLHLPTLQTLPLPLQRRAIFDYLKARKIPDLSSSLIDRALALIPPDAPPALSLPGGQRLRRKESRLFISS